MGRTGALEPASVAASAPNRRDHLGRNVLDGKFFKDGAIYLFRRSDYKKPIWFCRVKVPSVRGYIWRSTRTTDEHAAFKFADDLYNHTLVRALGGENLNSKKVGVALSAYAKRLEPDSKRLSTHNRILLIKRIEPLIGSKTFEQLDTSLISQLFDDLRTQSRGGKLSPNTVKRISSDLKHFLTWAVEEGYLGQLPRFPRLAGTADRRPHFDAKDWAKLTRYLREFVKVTNRSTRRDRTMLTNYVLILANTGIRVGEARTLKWRDIAEVGGSREGETNIVLNVTGKTGPREVVSRTSDVKIHFKRIHDMRIEELTTKDNPNPDLDTDGFVFCHKDGSPVGSFKGSFQALLRAAGVEKDTHGHSRTLYSLRHTYATFRLQQGVHQFILARNMGTSVAMLEQYYGHTSNIASADELTKQGKRSSTGKSSSLSWLK